MRRAETSGRRLNTQPLGSLVNVGLRILENEIHVHPLRRHVMAGPVRAHGRRHVGVSVRDTISRRQITSRIGDECLRRPDPQASQRTDADRAEDQEH